MLKFGLSLCLLFIAVLPATAQSGRLSDHYNNPFRDLRFLTGPTDTLTLTASYTGDYRKITDDDFVFLTCVDKLHGLNVKKFAYEIACKIDGYPQSFYVPCNNEGMTTILDENSKKSQTLKLKCVVYRFFTIDGDCNFFYIKSAAVITHHGI